MSEFTKLWENSQELKKYFATKKSFCTWMGFNFLIQNPTIEEIIKKAKKRFLTKTERNKFKKRHNR